MNPKVRISGQSRPKKQSNPGEIDLGIFSGNNTRLAICEALILEGRNAIETQKHNLKIFNYDPVRKLYYLLIYYKGDTNNFDSSWESYIDVVEYFVDFPQGYKNPGKVVEITLSDLSDTILLGKSIYGADIELYHIFINVNYRLALNKKKAGQAKPEIL
ncbi:hypothetical protein [Mucilaginibacter sp. FT3.2]|uniref:hypothetical protein n=1 Tax=Mucilaginibacter sp. FT3.2 TaxID=2723090 RepID=UPI00160C1710|nr:hypothetical protein [Mucilaginibacter sp. FT3.2]MBB6229745.1 hypothetical protein [Mucilaginibacter sp. FT3.2]